MKLHEFLKIYDASKNLAIYDNDIDIRIDVPLIEISKENEIVPPVLYDYEIIYMDCTDAWFIIQLDITAKEYFEKSHINDMAAALYDYSLDIDYFNYTESRNEDIATLRKAIQKLYESKETEDMTLYQVLELITCNF